MKSKAALLCYSHFAGAQHNNTAPVSVILARHRKCVPLARAPSK